MNVASITLYSTGWCPYCDRVRSLLKAKGASWTEFDVEAEPARRNEMIERSGRRTVPQIFIGARHIGGSDELHELEQRGDLDALLGAPPAG